MKERVWIALVCWALVGGISPVFAVDVAGNLDNAETELDRTLGNLKDSVAKLVEDNRQIARGSEELRVRIKTLKNDLVAAENENVKRAALLKSLEEKKQKRPGGGQSPEDQLAQAQDELERIKQEKVHIQQDLDQKAGDEEATRRKMEALKDELADLKSGGAGSSELQPEMVAFRTERDRLLREIQSTSDQLSRTREEWHEVSIPAVSPPTSQELNRAMEDKKKQIEGLKNELTGLKDAASRQESTLSSFMAHGNTSQFLSDLEADLAVQEEGVKALQRDLASLDQKAAGLSKKVTQEPSGTSKSLESQYNEAKVINAHLRSDLDRLRREMVRLDKKKSALEKELYRSRN